MTTILVIEDETGILEEIADLLELDGYQVITATNGGDGLALAQSNHPDLVISDIMMPGIGGYEVFEALKSDSQTANIPFIFLSALAAYDQIRQGMNLGADDYLTKPFNYQQLSQAVRTRLQKHSDSENRRLKALARHLIHSSDREREELAFIIEERISEPLNGLNLLLNNRRNNPSPAGITADELRTHTEQLIGQIQAITLQLRPTMLEHLSLSAALIWLVERYRVGYGLQVRFTHAGLTSRVATGLKLLIYRIFDDALQNIAQHAETTKADVSVRLREGVLHAEIVDSGRGFLLEDVQQSQVASGILRMVERASQAGGSLNIHSVPGSGTKISLTLPLDESAAASAIDHPAPLTQAAPSTSPARARLKGQIPLIIADDHEIIRTGLRQLLEQNTRFCICAEANSGEELLQRLQEQHAEIVILDMVMPGWSSMDLMRTLRSQYPDLQIMAFSPYPEEVHAVEALRSGANAYVLKESSAMEISEALNALAAGQQFISPSLADKLSDWEISSGQAEAEQAEIYETLTQREREILFLVIEGYSSAQVAERLFISRRTAETHRNNMMKKLGIHNLNQLMKYALRHNLLSPRK